MNVENTKSGFGRGIRDHTVSAAKTVLLALQVMPFADILDYAQFTAFINPDALVATQENAIDLLEVRGQLGCQAARAGLQPR